MLCQTVVWQLSQIAASEVSHSAANPAAPLLSPGRFREFVYFHFFNRWQKHGLGNPPALRNGAKRQQGRGGAELKLPHLAQEGQLATVRVFHSVHLVVDHGVHVDSDAVPGEDLLGRHVKSTRS